MSSKVFVPSTVSPEAAEYLAGLPGQEETYPPTPLPGDREGWREFYEGAEEIFRPIGEKVAAQCGVELRGRTLGGVPVLEVKPRQYREDGQDGRAILYLHGGAYVIGSAASTLSTSAPIADDTGLRVFAVDYPLAPQACYQQAVEAVLSVVEALTAEGFETDKLAFLGDSAGGGLAAGAVLAMRDRGMALPGCLVLQCPWSDLTETGDSYTTLRDHEATYRYDMHLQNCADAYAERADQKHPYVSPVYGDYSKGFPPTLIQGSTKEIFLSNFVRHYQALDTAGVPVKLDLYEGMPHDWIQDAPFLPESHLSRLKAAAFMETWLGVTGGCNV